MRANHRLSAILAPIAFVAMPSLVAAQVPPQCAAGQSVVDRSGNVAAILAGRDGYCLIKYKDGQTQRWVAITELSISRPAAPTTTSAPGPVAPTMAPPASSAGVTVLRPTLVNRLAYRADALGHIVLTAWVN